jgi:hypothetical protein
VPVKLAQDRVCVLEQGASYPGSLLRGMVCLLPLLPLAHPGPGLLQCCSCGSQQLCQRVSYLSPSKAHNPAAVHSAAVDLVVKTQLAGPSACSSGVVYTTGACPSQGCPSVA